MGRAVALDPAADDGGHVPGRNLDLPDFCAAADADCQCLRLGAGVVRRNPDVEGGAGPVHPAARREPDGVVPHRARADGIHGALGGVAAGRHVPGAGGRAGVPATGAVAAA
ncbi:hypothetical protein G6F59_017306 [Rhizopus arrhizus]|nr:hypothetical protein G6F59_017306 [Rhizopus arrhizus]